MNVLSLFDGMSCGQIALKELGIEPDIYYASEIDKFAIKQTQLNFPDTIQLGDVRNIKVADLEKIDLILGGSPCYNLSMIGKREGLSTKENIEVLSLEQYLDLKSKGIEFTGQSYLFWEFVRILEEAKKINPNILFLLENVEMGKKWESVFNKAIGTQGIHINSSLVSAQSRKRIYWTNINGGNIPQPKDEGLFLRDILEDEVDEHFFLSEKALKGIELHKERNKEKKNGFGADIRKPSDKSQTIRVGGKGVYDLVSIPSRKVIRLNKTNEFGKQPRQQNRIYDPQGISPAVLANMSCGSHAILDNFRIRRLTPTECAKLQTIPEWYKWQCSNTQQYKMLGNGWTVDVIVHILSHMKLNEIE